MARKYILPENEKRFKANLHSHTTCSDGVLSPAELKELYKSHGYSIVAFTDHHAYRYHNDLKEGNFLPLGGYELNFDEFDEFQRLRKTCHINAIAVDPEKVEAIEGQGVYGIEIINDAVSRLRKNGFIVNLNHPSWSNQGPEEVSLLEGFTALELYNSCCSMTYNTGENQLQYETLLRAGKKCHAIFADDVHGSSFAFSPRYAGGYSEDYNKLSAKEKLGILGLDCCRAHTIIFSPKLTYDAVIDSLAAGRFYSSNGPEIISFYIENEKICIDCSPARAVFLKTMAWGLSSSIIDPTGRITHVEFDFKSIKENNEVFFRIEVVDKNGSTACTNPYYF